MPQKSDDPKIHNLLVPVIPRQFEVVKAAAARHLSMASWARQTLMDEADPYCRTLVSDDERQTRGPCGAQTTTLQPKGDRP